MSRSPFVALDRAAEALVPAVFPTPFRQGEPHPIAMLAARALQHDLDTLVPESAVRGPEGGKMFGVLVVRDANGTLGYLRGHAGMIEGQRGAPGFVPPAFDEPAYEALWASEGREVEALGQRIAALAPEDARRESWTKEQRERSSALLPKLQATYDIRNALGQTRTLTELFEPRPVPGGAGDCAAPKLLAHAYRSNATPLALAEFWWGNPTSAGGRHHGVFYPACRGRCAKLLPFMLEGISCEPPPSYGNHGVLDDAPHTLYEDDDLCVVDKPSGLLAVPGRGAAHRDSVQSRLQDRLNLEDSSWPRLVHRLDQATSGLLIAAKHKEAYVAMQQQFSRRTIHKRYVALLRGRLNESDGEIDLPLGRDIDDRPRQKHDPLRGKPSLTRWRRLELHDEQTRVEFVPITGRTHQLRLHAAHPLGLGAPIVGDVLYGFGEPPRLMLHAEHLAFKHPRSGDALDFQTPAPF